MSRRSGKGGRGGRGRPKGGARSRQRRAGGGKRSRAGGQGSKRREARSASRSRPRTDSGSSRAGTIREGDSTGARQQKTPKKKLSRRDKADAVRQALNLMGMGMAAGGTKGDGGNDQVFDQEHKENVETVFGDGTDTAAFIKGARLFGEEVEKVNQAQPQLSRKEAARAATKQAAERVKSMKNSKSKKE